MKFEVIHKGGKTIPTIWHAVRREADDAPWYELAVFLSEDRHKYEQELMLARQRAEKALAKDQQARRELAAAQAEVHRARALAEDRALFAEQMVGVVSHDLRNPLSVISMSVNLLTRFGVLNDKQMRVMGQLSGSTARAIRLIADLLDFTQARIGNGLQVDLVELDLHAVVAACVAELQLIYPDLPLWHVAEGSGRCAASADRLAQMIGNLVSNAVSYGAPACRSPSPRASAATTWRSLEISALQSAAYDEIVRMAADTFDTPIALISILDGDRQWFKARVGLQAAETPRKHAFCAHAIEDKAGVMVVEDAALDARFADNPLVTGQPSIRFYAGAPLVTSARHALGTVCVIDTKPRTLDDEQLRTLQLMAQEVVAMMESRVQGVLRRGGAGTAEAAG